MFQLAADAGAADQSAFKDWIDTCFLVSLGVMRPTAGRLLPPALPSEGKAGDRPMVSTSSSRAPAAMEGLCDRLAADMTAAMRSSSQLLLRLTEAAVLETDREASDTARELLITGGICC